MTIDERNHLRIEAGLPQLNVAIEAARPAAVERERLHSTLITSNIVIVSPNGLTKARDGFPEWDGRPVLGSYFEWNLRP